MAGSIYNIAEWSSLATYAKHFVVKNNNSYYYSLQDHVASASFSADLGSGLWGGYITDSNGESKPSFLWTPSISSEIAANPRVKTISFGDGYSQRTKDGINNNLLSLQLSFDGRTLIEAKAILHFLYTREGVESFLWTPPEPFNKQKRFICKEFPMSTSFFGAYNIRCTFEEVVS